MAREVHRAWRVLLLYPDAIAMRNRVLTAKYRREALDIGSKGGLDNTSRTVGRLQAGQLRG